MPKVLLIISERAEDTWEEHELEGKIQLMLERLKGKKRKKEEKIRSNIDH